MTSGIWAMSPAARVEEGAVITSVLLGVVSDVVATVWPCLRPQLFVLQIHTGKMAISRLQ